MGFGSLEVLRNQKVEAGCCHGPGRRLRAGGSRLE